MIWDAVLRSIAKRPVFGWGYNAFWQGFKGESADVFLIVRFPIPRSQNGPLEVLLALGGVGLGLVLMTFVQGFRNLLHCFRLGATDETVWYLPIILLTIYYSIGEAYLQQPNSLGSMMYILACTGCSRRLSVRTQACRCSIAVQVLRGACHYPLRPIGTGNTNKRLRNAGHSTFLSAGQRG